MSRITSDRVSCVVLVVFLASLCQPSAVSGRSVQRTKEDVDLTVITWAHAVNSVNDLDAALSGDIMMIEADVSMGLVFGQPITQPIQPIMAHPPAILSDLSFDRFLREIIEKNSNVSSVGEKKGIKLDFKDINALEPCLQVIQSLQNQVDFAIWLNADILYGPINSTGKPVDAVQFLKLTSAYFPEAMLSPGWTTRYGGLNNITGGRYEKEQLEEMTDVLMDNVQLKVPPTFPLRAGIAAETPIEDLEAFLQAQQLPGATITMWSSEGDFVNKEKLKLLVNTLGRNRIYLDLPFQLDLD